MAMTEIAIIKMATTDMAMIDTDMTKTDLVKYAMMVYDLRGSDVVELNIPAEGTYESVNVGKVSATKVCDFEVNRKILANILQ